MVFGVLRVAERTGESQECFRESQWILGVPEVCCGVPVGLRFRYVPEGFRGITKESQGNFSRV